MSKRTRNWMLVTLTGAWLVALGVRLTLAGPERWPAHDMGDPDFGDGPTPFPKPPQPPKPHPDGFATEDTLSIWLLGVWVSEDGLIHDCPAKAEESLRDLPSAYRAEYERIEPLRGRLRVIYDAELTAASEDRRLDLLNQRVLAEPSRSDWLIGAGHTVTVLDANPPPGTQLLPCSGDSWDCPVCTMCWCSTAEKGPDGKVKDCKSTIRDNCDVQKKINPCITAAPDPKAEIVK